MIFILFISCLVSFILFAVRIFLLSGEFFFCRKNFSFIVIIFLSQLECFFCCQDFSLSSKNFSFAVRIFLSRENVSFAVRIFPLKIILPKVKIFVKPYKIALVGCLLVLNFVNQTFSQFRERRRLQSKKALVDCVACAGYSEQDLFIV